MMIHAIDGGMFGHALCEEPAGDTANHEGDVTCSDCLDLVESADQDLMGRLYAAGWGPLPSWARGPRGEVL